MYEILKKKKEFGQENSVLLFLEGQVRNLYFLYLHNVKVFLLLFICVF